MIGLEADVTEAADTAAENIWKHVSDAEIQQRMAALLPAQRELQQRVDGAQHHRIFGSWLIRALKENCAPYGQRIYEGRLETNGDPPAYIISETVFRGAQKVTRVILSISSVVTAGITYHEKPELYAVGSFQRVKRSDFEERSEQHSQKYKDLLCDIMVRYQQEQGIRFEPQGTCY